ncbi:hypothetical protein IWZ03DRAFT_363828 [Phyllosticta citriasiana]|uniref:Uncharacterized protein n=1 Tax=Phyllosticta citriasiana TaxID=595635 RepID=A0ABR1K860_9PEZI
MSTTLTNNKNSKIIILNNLIRPVLTIDKKNAKKSKKARTKSKAITKRNKSGKDTKYLRVLYLEGVDFILLGPYSSYKRIIELKLDNNRTYLEATLAKATPSIGYNPYLIAKLIKITNTLPYITIIIIIYIYSKNYIKILGNLKFNTIVLSRLARELIDKELGRISLYKRKLYKPRCLKSLKESNIFRHSILN